MAEEWDFLKTKKYKRGLWDERLWELVVKYYAPMVDYQPADDEQQRKQHIDCFVNGVPIDNKGAKNCKEYCYNGYDRFTFLEKYDSKGNDGWLFGGKAKYITFKRTYHAEIIISPREYLIELYKEKARYDLPFLTVIPNDTFAYRILQRYNRSKSGEIYRTKEEAIFVPFTDIANCKVIKIPQHLHEQDLIMEVNYIQGNYD